jgi:3-hydroxyisobutyrate dehydrogenase-like beta-hydroxyacid dehydrogenase
MQQTVGFIGLGIMGAHMARNLAAKGFSLRLYNRTPDKARQLADEIGATFCDTAAQAAQGAMAVVSMLFDDEAVESVTTGEEGILAGLATGAIHISASTIAPETSRKLAPLHAERGVHYVGAPVFGRPNMAEAAKLHMLLSGADAATRANVRPILEAIGQSVWDFGDDPGAANIVKVCGNFMIFAAVEAMAEAFTLAEKSGIERMAIYEMLTSTIFATPAYQAYGKMVASETYEPVGASLPLALKDVRLFEELGRQSQTPLPTAALLDQKITSALAKGRGHLDAAVFAQEISEAAGLKRE